MKLHTLKIKTKYFVDVTMGLKTFELRKNDRDYQVGDLITFEVINATGDIFPKEYNVFQITYILKDCPEYGLDKDYVILGIKPLETGVYL